MKVNRQICDCNNKATIPSKIDGTEYNSQHFMTTYTDTQLKITLAKMLPDVIDSEFMSTSAGLEFMHLIWKQKPSWPAVLDTELLHLCWLVGSRILPPERDNYLTWLARECDKEHRMATSYWLTHTATWQQRTIALAKVKGVEIV